MARAMRLLLDLKSFVSVQAPCLFVEEHQRKMCIDWWISLLLEVCWDCMLSLQCREWMLRGHTVVLDDSNLSSSRVLFMQTQFDEACQPLSPSNNAMIAGGQCSARRGQAVGPVTEADGQQSLS